MLYALRLSLFLLFAYWGPVHASDCPRDYSRLSTLIDSNLSRIQANNRFRVNRSLGQYRQVLDVFGRNSFSRFLHSLRRDDHWIDMGAGMAVPMMEMMGGTFKQDVVNYVRAQVLLLIRRNSVDQPDFIRPHAWANRSSNLPRMTALVLSDNFQLDENTKSTLDAYQHLRRNADPNLFRYLSGRPIEAYEEPIRQIGRARLITDVFGPASYTSDLERVLTQYLRLLENDGAAYIFGMFSRTKFFDKNGLELFPTEFLSRIGGISFEVSSNERGITARLIRTRDALVIPRMRLNEISLSESISPTRVFQLLD
jgi:hypothetical protein